METPKIHILCPIGGSDRSLEVLPAIMPIVRGADSRVTLLQVEREEGDPPAPQGSLRKIQEALLAHSVPVECRSRRGPPEREIPASAAELGADLVALETRGRTALSRWKRPSLAERLARLSGIPLLVCRPGQRLRGWKRILLPLDETASPEKGLVTETGALARLSGASVEILQTVLPPPFMAYGSNAKWMEDYSPEPPFFRPALVESARRLRSMGVEVHLTGGWILGAAGILDRASAGDIDLICLDSGGGSALSRWILGSAAGHILRNAPCPVYLRPVRARSWAAYSTDAAPEGSGWARAIASNSSAGLKGFSR